MLCRSETRRLIQTFFPVASKFSCENALVVFTRTPFCTSLFSVNGLKKKSDASNQRTDKRDGRVLHSSSITERCFSLAADRRRLQESAKSTRPFAGSLFWCCFAPPTALRERRRRREGAGSGPTATPETQLLEVWTNGWRSWRRYVACRQLLYRGEVGGTAGAFSGTEIIAKGPPWPRQSLLWTLISVHVILLLGSMPAKGVAGVTRWPHPGSDLCGLTSGLARKRRHRSDHARFPGGGGGGDDQKPNENTTSQTWWLTSAIAPEARKRLSRSRTRLAGGAFVWLSLLREPPEL